MNISVLKVFIKTSFAKQKLHALRWTVIPRNCNTLVLLTGATRFEKTIGGIYGGEGVLIMVPPLADIELFFFVVGPVFDKTFGTA